MAARAESKVQEGLRYSQEAEKCLKTGWFRKADHDGAAQAYTKAGNAFRNAKSFEQAKAAFLKASDEQRFCNSLYQSGKALELAGQMSKELKQMEEAVDLTKQAGLLFRENGTPDTASQVFQRAAKLAEGINDTKAIELYGMAIEMYEIEDKVRQAADTLGKSIRLMVKLKRFEECIKSMQKQIEFYSSVGSHPPICRTVVGLVVVHLARQDPVAADEVFKNAISVPGFCDSDESVAIEQLLDACEKGDPDAMAQAVSQPVFTYQDNELAKLARDLKVLGELNISQVRELPQDKVPPLTVAHKAPQEEPHREELPREELPREELPRETQQTEKIEEQGLDEQETKDEEQEDEQVKTSVQDEAEPKTQQAEYNKDFEGGLS